MTGAAAAGILKAMPDVKKSAEKPKARKKSPSRRRPDPRPIDWDRVSDEELLAKRICDLPVEIAGSVLEERIRTVTKNLDAKGIAFHPPVYLGDEWFSPEGDPVISVPFYLAHPRLIRLEKSRVLEAEGETRLFFLKLLRHEMGHAISHAYRLHEFPGYTKIFGASKKGYPDKFRPRHYSRKYVTHLPDWYAQIHSDEDYAETFAVWLTPGLDWRVGYRGWPALKKLEFVDRMMREAVIGRVPKKRSAPKWRRLSTIRMTIAHYHKIKRKQMGEDFPDYFDRELRALFSGEMGPSGESAAKFLRRHRASLEGGIARWTGEKKYTVRNLVARFTQRAGELRLYVGGSETKSLAQVSACLTAMATNYFLTGKYKRVKGA